MSKLLHCLCSVLAISVIAAGISVCQVVEPPPLPEAPAEAAPYEPFLDAGAKLPPKELLNEMAKLFEDIKRRYKLYQYTKMEKRTKDLRNMADNLKRKNKETPNPTAFYAGADQLRNWTVKLRDATQQRNGDEMYMAIRRMANHFNDCYVVLGEPKKVSSGQRWDPPPHKAVEHKAKRAEKKEERKAKKEELKIKKAGEEEEEEEGGRLHHHY